jgi:hypothetical protein
VRVRFNRETAGRGWALPDLASARARLALGYPYPAPAAAYTFRAGAVAPFDPACLKGRTPVIAHGSNRAPGQLARKFAAFEGEAATIPVSFAWLHDYDVVYSAHITTYGAVASTLQHVPGVRVRVAVTWLDTPQLARMHETEGNYGFGQLRGARVCHDAPLDAAGEAAGEAGEEAPPRPSLAMYLSDHGHLADDGGAPVGLAAVEAHGRPHAARSQGQVLEMLRRRLAPGRGFESFILDNVDCAATRRARIAALTETAGATRVPHFLAEDATD